ncbi:MAG TPA: SDR family NAD(P)-dependent oxidoreductase [Gemmatimonadaceae bacterium]|nr:SDR family NAD(P)-dependent oxidoreductase [Gemmatimonadaceae bacterium]
MKGLAGKRALVTGGSRGIGAATAQLFAEHDVHVAVGYRSRSADADALVASLRAAHGITAVAHAADISTETGGEELVQRAAESLGGLDFFVANAGIWPCDDVAVSDMTSGQWRRTMGDNLDSVFYTTRAAIRAINDHGRIILVSSTAGQRGEAYHADYAATKGAIISMVKSLAPELGKRDITVNSVAPGWVDTEMCELPFANGGRDRIAAGIPIGRIAAPRDIAGPIVFLCSDLARHITGEILNVNGGSVLCG